MLSTETFVWTETHCSVKGQAAFPAIYTISHQLITTYAALDVKVTYRSSRIKDQHNITTLPNLSINKILTVLPTHIADRLSNATFNNQTKPISDSVLHHYNYKASTKPETFYVKIFQVCS